MQVKAKVNIIFQNAKQIFLREGDWIWNWSHAGPSRWSGLTANKFVILDHPLPQQAGPSTWSGPFVKKNDAVHNVYFVQYDAPVSKMPLDITCIVYLCIWYRGILRGNHGFRVWKLQKYGRMYFPHTGTNKCSMGYQNSIFKNGLSLFSCAEKYTVKTLCSGPCILSSGQPLHMIRIDCKIIILERPLLNRRVIRTIYKNISFFTSLMDNDYNEELKSGLVVKIL